MKKQLLSLTVASLVCTGIAQANFYIGIEGGYTGGARDTKSKNYDTQTNSSYFLTPGNETLKNIFQDNSYASANGTLETEPWKGYNLAISFGSESFFANNYLGARWGASVGYTEISQDYKTYDQTNWTTYYTDYRAYIDAGLSFDLMINLISSSNFSFGVFGGIEGAYHYLVYNDRETSKSNQLINLLNDSAETPSRNSLDFSGRVGVSTLLAKHHRIDLTAKLPIGYVVAGSGNKVQIAHDIVKASFNVGYKYVF